MKLINNHLHPLKKLLGDNFGGPSGISIAGSVSLDNQAQAELARYTFEPQSTLDHCSLQWWKDYQTVCLLLTRLTRKYLCLLLL